MKKFTKEPTPCIKCGNESAFINRRFRKDISYSADASEPPEVIEYLLCHCSSCGYEWEQETKDANEEKED